MLAKKDQKFNWGKAQEKAFRELKQQLTSSPTLAHFQEGDPIEIHTDGNCGYSDAEKGRKAASNSLNTRLEGREKLLVIPDKLQSEILSECHDNPLIGGHLRVARTLDKIRRRHYRQELLKDVEAYVRTCAYCQTKKGTNHKPAGLLQPIPTGEPFDRVNICLLDPFPKTH
ncbi:hypothetical protein PR048_006710 [Dryococelus australis]|uniref:RNA-directed DNA polymerase n=1 Tax=Dryococelus australis TaxID=614101 RepID=A0ABQ9ID14_9NEOP|nr:hypothetical protein PR048_006710 [Dryococelus australis]